MGPITTFPCQNSFPAWCVCGAPDAVGPKSPSLWVEGTGGYLGWCGGKTRIASGRSRMGENICAGLELLGEKRTLVTEQLGSWADTPKLESLVDWPGHPHLAFLPPSLPGCQSSSLSRYFPINPPGGSRNQHVCHTWTILI